MSCSMTAIPARVLCPAALLEMAAIPSYSAVCIADWWSTTANTTPMKSKCPQSSLCVCVSVLAPTTVVIKTVTA